MKAILTDADIKIFLSGLFVDDCRYLTSSLPDGVRMKRNLSSEKSGKVKIVFKIKIREPLKNFAML